MAQVRSWAGLAYEAGPTGFTLARALGLRSGSFEFGPDEQSSSVG
jgi:hypothetical protein